MEDALNYSELSLNYFTDINDKQRRWIDRTYIYCDLKDKEKAIIELQKAVFLPEDLNEPLPELSSYNWAKNDNSYLQAAFVRLCRLDPDLFSGYPTESILSHFKRENPWQCWGNACGYLLAKRDPDLARRCLQASFEVCFEPCGETFVPMGLLPLATSLEMGLKTYADICDYADQILSNLRSLCEKRTLCLEHFAEVCDAKTPLEALEIVWDKQETLFPFNYR